MSFNNPQVKWKKFSWWLIVSFLLIIFLGWFAVNQWDAYRTVTYVIPANVGEEDVIVDFPEEIILTLGVKDTLIIHNEDDVTHNLGPFVIGPNATLTKRFNRPITYEGACTFHKTQQMRLVVNPAPWSIFSENEG